MHDDPPIWIVWALLVLLLFGVPWAIHQQKKRQFEKEFSKLWGLWASLGRDLAPLSPEQNQEFITALYNFFVDLWRRWPMSEKTDELFAKFLFHSSSEKLSQIFFIHSTVAAMDVNPRVTSIADNLLACACMAEVFRREYRKTKIASYVHERTRPVYEFPLVLCPTLQPYSWHRWTFKGLREEHPLHPFVRETTFPSEGASL